MWISPSAWLLLLLAALIPCPALGLVSVGALLIGICVDYKLVDQKSVFSWKGVHRSMTQVLTPKVTLSRSLQCGPGHREKSGRVPLGHKRWRNHSETKTRTCGQVRV